MRLRRLIRLLLPLLISLPAAHARADGGTVRAIERINGMQISVFTSPVVLVAGEADVSVLVQDGESLITVPTADIEVELIPRERPDAVQRVPASAPQATNKLFQASHVTLEAGQYDVVVVVTAKDRVARVKCAIEVGNPHTRAASFWPWFAWPLVPILVLAADQWRKKS